MRTTPLNQATADQSRFAFLDVSVQQVGAITVDPTMAYTFTPADKTAPIRQGTFDARQGAELLRLASKMREDGNRIENPWSASYSATVQFGRVTTSVFVDPASMSSNDEALRDTLFAWVGVPAATATAR